MSRVFRRQAEAQPAEEEEQRHTPQDEEEHTPLDESVCCVLAQIDQVLADDEQAQVDQAHTELRAAWLEWYRTTDPDREREAQDRIELLKARYAHLISAGLIDSDLVGSCTC